MPRDRVITMGRKLEQLESGDTVTVSGFYLSNHRECEAANVWIRSHGRLPVCPRCGKSATFRLQKEIEHISEDADFK